MYLLLANAISIAFGTASAAAAPPPTRTAENASAEIASTRRCRRRRRTCNIRAVKCTPDDNKSKHTINELKRHRRYPLGAHPRLPFLGPQSPTLAPAFKCTTLHQPPAPPNARPGVTEMPVSTRQCRRRLALRVLPRQSRKQLK